MKLSRGDFVLVRFPFASGSGSKVRPAVVVQSDLNNQRLSNVIVAAVTTTVHRSGEPTQLLIEVSTPVGRRSGLIHDSVVTCENLATLDQSLVLRRLGSLPSAAMAELDSCLRAALGLG
jgi:mRNA interferase MazF